MKKAYKDVLVSIVTPTFNSEKFIEQTILNVKQQSYPYIEHIIIDGGSSDRTLGIINRHPEVFVISEADEGMYDAVNKGLRLAHGEIVAYLNSDDLYLHNTVEIVVSSFKRWQELELIYGDCYFIDEQGKILYKYYSPQFDWDLFVARRGSLIIQPTAFWAKRIHKKYGFFDAAYKLSGDYDFFMRVCSGRKVKHCGQVIAIFRIHPKAKSQTLMHKMKSETLDIWNTWRQIHKNNKKIIFWKSLRLRLLNWKVMLNRYYWKAFFVKHCRS